MKISRREIERSAFGAINQIVKPAVRAGFGSPLPVGGGVVLLETTGRHSGLARQVPLMAWRVGKTIKVSTLRDDSDWVANLEANASGAVWINGRRSEVLGKIERGSLTVATLTHIA